MTGLPPESVLLDADVLHKSMVRIFLLWAAYFGVYRPLCTDQILGELERSLLSVGLTQEQVERALARIRANEQIEMIEGYEVLIDRMTNHAKDRHVLAAAVKGRADAIVTYDKTGFPLAICAPYGIEPLTPDELLERLWSERSEALWKSAQTMAESLGYKSTEALLHELSRYVPRFVALVLPLTTPCNRDEGPVA